MEDLAGRLRQLSEQLSTQLPHITTEEATKSALVLPFIQALGYNIFDPTEVVPELTADVGIKKGEKVDYAILRNEKPILLFECKTVGTDLDRVTASQLYRYFSVTDARFAILTNGVEYRFFTDLDARNRMDSKPFLDVSLSELSNASLRELERFQAENFDEAAILETASELKNTRELKRLLAAELSDPSDDFVRFFASQVYKGHLTRSVRSLFKRLTRNALHDYIGERVSSRLKSALETEEKAEGEAANAAEAQPKIVTTEDEWQGYYMVKAIVSKVVDSKRVAIRDHQGYCSVLLDDNNRKPICRLWFNGPQKYLGTFDSEKKETRHPIDAVEDIYSHQVTLRETATGYDSDSSRAESTESVE